MPEGLTIHRINHMVYELARSAKLSEQDLDAVFAALAHSARRAVLRQIARADAPLAMNELAAATGISPQLLNKHAASLERAGLITRERQGRETRAIAHPDMLQDAGNWIEEMTAYWNTQFDSLGRYVEALRDQADEPRLQKD
ncbi:helix-turn-helix domain-containing protein [Agromyces sp. SYSU K20354]|uniref:ArsR/SmtB family transcription factor n=1 Tax=Agromyces cavernae TaxID=2898659 RepID=UPI001E402EB2|nr:MarR family transcriptional regulator [Agromyces cavernae]MCD2440977.1 helix-turn-helix domain-containing protein [Agromyces cavernae]